MPSLNPKNQAAVLFITLKNPVQVPQQVVQEITRDGLPGVAYRLLGRRGKPFDLVGVVDSDSATAAESLLTRLASAVGGMCSVTDDHGNQFSDVMLLDVQREDQRKIQAGVGGVSTSKGYLVAVRLTCQIAAES